MDLSIDLNIIKFKSNIWQRNYASTAPIIRIIFGRYTFQNETFLQNGNSFNETFALLGFDILDADPIPDISTLLGTNSGNLNLQLQGVICADQVYELIITNCTFDQNWGFDAHGGNVVLTPTDLYVLHPGGNLFIGDTVISKS